MMMLLTGKWVAVTDIAKNSTVLFMYEELLQTNIYIIENVLLLTIIIACFCSSQRLTWFLTGNFTIHTTTL